MPKSKGKGKPSRAVRFQRLIAEGGELRKELSTTGDKPTPPASEPPVTK